MHDSETRALKRAVLLLLVISALRWGWSARPSALAPSGDTVLPELLEASRQAAEEEARRGEPLAEGELVDPNIADAIELDRLPGVGPSTARAVVAAREAGAVFREPEDLLEVPGVGPATLDRMRSALAFEGARSARRPVPVVDAVRRPDGPAGPVDVNLADLEALQRLPGIGPALAERILVTRREQPFTSLDDLVRVRGIGPATVERLRAHAVAAGRP
jgi:competence ComEA-like helix-hairpin-helix protein